MDEIQLIKQTFLFVEEQLKDDYSGHDMNHIKRVYDLGCRISENIECDKLIVKLALILHDIDDPKITKMNTGDCMKARIYLNTLDIDRSIAEKVCDIINKISFSKNKNEKQDLSIEGQIVQDADRLDALGAIGIARTFQYGGQNSRSMNSSLAHFDEKLFLLYDLLNTEYAKEIGVERHNFVVNFYNQFKKESLVEEKE